MMQRITGCFSWLFASSSSQHQPLQEVAGKPAASSSSSSSSAVVDGSPSAAVVPHFVHSQAQEHPSDVAVLSQVEPSLSSAVSHSPAAALPMPSERFDSASFEPSVSASSSFLSVNGRDSVPHRTILSTHRLDAPAPSYASPSPTSARHGVFASASEFMSTSSWARRDINAYLQGYPDAEEDRLDLNENYRFYCNEIPSRPEGDFIDHIHQQWKGQYRKLEVHHAYIQWLFPIREHGMNSQQHPLQKHEMERMRANPRCLARLLRSYRMMLDFYGFELSDDVTGELVHTAHHAERMHNLITSSHNFLRVTRILKCLGELGFEELKLGFVLALLNAAFTKDGRPMRSSAIQYWLPTLRDPADVAIVNAVLADELQISTAAEYRAVLQDRAAQRPAVVRESKNEARDELKEEEDDEHKLDFEEADSRNQ